MVYALAAETVALLALLCVLVSFERSNRQERNMRADAYERTLQLMADRIQRPDRLPARSDVQFIEPEREPDEWHRVGQVEIDPDYGLTVEP